MTIGCAERISQSPPAILLQELHGSLTVQEEKNSTHGKSKKATEHELELLKKQLQDLETNVRKSQSETQAREYQIKSLQVLITSAVCNPD